MFLMNMIAANPGQNSSGDVATGNQRLNTIVAEVIACSVGLMDLDLILSYFYIKFNKVYFCGIIWEVWNAKGSSGLRRIVIA